MTGASHSLTAPNGASSSWHYADVMKVKEPEHSVACDNGLLRRALFPSLRSTGCEAGRIFLPFLCYRKFADQEGEAPMSSDGVVEFTVRVPIAFKKSGGKVVACCPILDVFSQGRDREEAQHNLLEALQLFLISCYERRVLDDVLVEAGFKPLRKAPRRDLDQDYLEVPVSLLAAKDGRPNHAC